MKRKKAEDNQLRAAAKASAASGAAPYLGRRLMT